VWTFWLCPENWCRRFGYRRIAVFAVNVMVVDVAVANFASSRFVRHPPGALRSLTLAPGVKKRHRQTMAWLARTSSFQGYSSNFSGLPINKDIRSMYR
jgi:hypothetical protein